MRSRNVKCTIILEINYQRSLLLLKISPEVAGSNTSVRFKDFRSCYVNSLSFFFLMKGKSQISIGVSDMQVNVQPAERKLARLDQLKRQHGSTHFPSWHRDVWKRSTLGRDGQRNPASFYENKQRVTKIIYQNRIQMPQLVELWFFKLLVYCAKIVS